METKRQKAEFLRKVTYRIQAFNQQEASGSTGHKINGYLNKYDIPIMKTALFSDSTHNQQSIAETEQSEMN